jgi:hypothetical protein
VGELQPDANGVLEREEFPYQTGRYLEDLPASFMKSLDFEKVSQEFGEFLRPGRITVR